jgi:hypothetical protein
MTKTSNTNIIIEFKNREIRLQYSEPAESH